ncbi:MAG: dUTP diphosphatase [Candidatus Latescibacteria bacterium]|jgi:dUTP pyrophosphatase|nr:dUTP diphosphatase [Candidatus Latescibacterota bacterium]
MEEITVRIVSSHPGRAVPEYMSSGAAGLDLSASLDAPLIIDPGQVALVGTGVQVAIPPGYEGQVRPRSGLAMKHRLGILNSPGTIDSDYRGEVGVLLINFGSDPYTVNNDDRIAQMVVSAVPLVRIERVERLDPTERGSGGFGHTGQ